MANPGQRTTRLTSSQADPPPTPTRVEAELSAHPVIVVGDQGLPDLVHRLIDAVQAGGQDKSDTAAAKPAVVRVPSFLSAMGEAAKTPAAAVVGPARSLSGMAASTAESLRKLAPNARLVLLRSPADAPHATADDEDIRLALESGFDQALPPNPDLPALARALDLVLPTSDPKPASSPTLRRIDPHDLSDLDLGPASSPPDDSSHRNLTATPTPQTHDLPGDQATLDAALPRDFQDSPPPTTPIGASAAEGQPESALGDTDLVNLVLRGEGGMKDMALSMIESQSGLPGVRFHEPGELPDDHDQAKASAEVVQGDQTFGQLTSTDPEVGPQLAVWADWLVHWLCLEAQFSRLRDLAMKDELTGVWNRRYFNHFLKKILDRAAAGRQQVTLLVFDIDDFKLYNDAYGHPAGDQILKGVASLMKSSVREHDVVARIGGDEFAVIFWDAGQEPRKAHSKHPDDVLNAAKRFQKAVCDHRFPKLLDKAHGTLTISGGLAGFPWDGRTPEELLEAADTMAMRSKQQGKNAITFGPGAQVDPDAQ